MGIERHGKDGELLHMSPAPWDPHMHPRGTDGITEDAFIQTNNGIEGKAGFAAYSKAALRAGFAGGNAMPNELQRLYMPNVNSEEQTEVVPFPISNIDRTRAMHNAVVLGSVIPIAINAGIDPDEIFSDEQRQCIDYDVAEKNFYEVKDEVSALKLWGDVSTGGFNVQRHFIEPLARRWFKHNPEKPIILHLEDEGVGEVLADISKTKLLRSSPFHIAHVSSRQELEPILDAKSEGLNLTCEATVHHLFLTDEERNVLGGYGCVKPSLKSQDDIDFLWDNIDQIDMFASDCAPHRHSDKEAENPAFGVTNHSVMLPLLIGAVAAGRISYEQLHEKLALAPRGRFNIETKDDSFVEVALEPVTVSELENRVRPRYGHNPFARLETVAPMIGRVVDVKAGVSWLSDAVSIRTSYTHQVRSINNVRKTS